MLKLLLFNASHSEVRIFPVFCLLFRDKDEKWHKDRACYELWPERPRKLVLKQRHGWLFFLCPVGYEAHQSGPNLWELFQSILCFPRSPCAPGKNQESSSSHLSYVSPKCSVVPRTVHPESPQGGLWQSPRVFLTCSPPCLVSITPACWTSVPAADFDPTFGPLGLCKYYHWTGLTHFLAFIPWDIIGVWSALRYITKLPVPH